MTLKRSPKSSPFALLTQAARNFAQERGLKLDFAGALGIDPNLTSSSSVQQFQDAALSTFRPWPGGPQEQFVTDEDTFEILYGGAAGGGKSAALIGLALRRSRIPRHQTIMFRKTYPQINGADGLAQKSAETYAGTGMTYRPGDLTWTAPNGAQVQFRHMSDSAAHLNYQGLAYQNICFDELTQFTEREYLYLISRARSTMPGVKPIIRATSNPGGPGHDWVLRRWAAWLDPEHPNPARPGEVRWYKRGADGKEEEVPEGTPLARSRAFIPALLTDNPALMHDEEYMANLNSLPELDRARLLYGDWTATIGESMYFKRTMFPLLTLEDYGKSLLEDPVVTRVRVWDRAATEPTDANRDPDWTVGTLMGKRASGRFVVEEVVRFRKGPHFVEHKIKQTAQADAIRYGVDLRRGGVITILTQDPGQAGKYERMSYARQLGGHDVRWVLERSIGDKETRARPAAALAQAGKIDVVAADWNRDWFSELEGFPLALHDDQVDSFSLAAICLNDRMPARSTNYQA